MKKYLIPACMVTEMSVSSVICASPGVDDPAIKDPFHNPSGPVFNNAPKRIVIKRI